MNKINLKEVQNINKVDFYLLNKLKLISNSLSDLKICRF